MTEQPLTVEAIEAVWKRANSHPWRAVQFGKDGDWDIANADGVLGNVWLERDARAFAAAPEHIAWLIAEVRRRDELVSSVLTDVFNELRAGAVFENITLAIAIRYTTGLKHD